MTVDTQQMRNWIGHTAYGADGDKIGKIDDIYLDEETGKPEWLAVSTGMFGSKVSFVPITGASSEGDDVRLQFSKEQVKGAPTAEPDGALRRRRRRSSTSTTAWATPRRAPTRACRRVAPATPATRRRPAARPAVTTTR
jgi:sporulation protein YlmC with PRC-barrel domain